MQGGDRTHCKGRLPPEQTYGQPIELVPFAPQQQGSPAPSEEEEEAVEDPAPEEVEEEEENREENIAVYVKYLVDQAKRKHRLMKRLWDLQDEHRWLHNSQPLTGTSSTSVFSSARRGDVSGLAAALKSLPESASAFDEWDATPLYYAALCGHEDVVRVLIASCADASSTELRLLNVRIRAALRGGGPSPVDLRKLADSIEGAELQTADCNADIPALLRERADTLAEALELVRELVLERALREIGGDYAAVK